MRDRELSDADGFRCGLRHLRLIVQCADHREPEPRPWRAEASRQGDHAEQDADGRQDGKCRTGDDGALQHRGIHPHSLARPVRPHKKNNAYDRDKQDNSPAKGIHKRTVQLLQHFILLFLYLEFLMMCLPWRQPR